MCLSGICGDASWIQSSVLLCRALASSSWILDPPMSVGSCKMKYHIMLKLSWIPTCQGWSPRFIKLFRLAARWTRQLYGSFPCSNLQKENIVTHQPEKLYFLQQEALQILCSQISLHSSIPPLWKNSHGKTGRYFNQEMALISISNSCFPFNSILHSAVCLWKLPLITFFISQCSEMANGPAHLISPSCMIMFHQVYS